jgi:hypothetical protein
MICTHDHIFVELSTIQSNIFWGHHRGFMLISSVNEPNAPERTHLKGFTPSSNVVVHDAPWFTFRILLARRKI